MKALKLKTLAYSLSVISGLWLAGCSQKAAEAPPPEAPAPVVQAAPASKPEVTVETTPAPAEELATLGLFTGKFDPTDEYQKASDAYEKINEERGYEDTRNIKDIPAQFRPYMVQDPLTGGYYFIAPNRLSIVIDEIRDDKTFSAHSIAAGNLRPITGTWEKLDAGLHLVGSEPGDNKYDGSFDMKLNANGSNSLVGTWTPNSDKTKSKAFTLARKDFKYDAELAQGKDDGDGMYFGQTDFSENPSIKILKTADVENLTQPQIRVIRNFIFARHGYSFNNRDLRTTFERYDWYTPVTNDVKADLTDVEKKNLALLARYEKYADKHYDEFGR